MRSATILLAAAIAAVPLATPALAQVQQGNPNAADRALSSEGQMRALQQNQTSQSDMTRMNLERSQTTTMPPPGGGLPGGAAPRMR